MLYFFSQDVVVQTFFAALSTAIMLPQLAFTITNMVRTYVTQNIALFCTTVLCTPLHSNYTILTRPILHHTALFYFTNIFIISPLFFIISSTLFIISSTILQLYSLWSSAILIRQLHYTILYHAALYCPYLFSTELHYSNPLYFTYHLSHSIYHPSSIIYCLVGVFPLVFSYTASGSSGSRASKSTGSETEGESTCYTCWVFIR